VTGVEIHPDRSDIEEVTEQTCTARIELGGPSGTRHVTARLDLGLTLAVASGAPVLVADAVMDRLAVPVPDGDALGPFREAKPVRGEGEQAVFVVDRRAGRVFQVAGGLGGQRPRFEPRNMDFGEGLEGWLFGGSFTEHASQTHWQDYTCAVEHGTAAVRSAVPQPAGIAFLAAGGWIELRNPELIRRD
jgi:hypothetical protein